MKRRCVAWAGWVVCAAVAVAADVARGAATSSPAATASARAAPSAAWRWIRQYWRLDSNPNMPTAESKAGLYYYHHVFAKAMRAWGEPVVSNLKGAKHNWRHELIDALAERVRDDGSWVNDNRRWWENSSVLATCYAMLALSEALRPPAAEAPPTGK